MRGRSAGREGHGSGLAPQLVRLWMTRQDLAGRGGGVRARGPTPPSPRAPHPGSATALDRLWTGMNVVPRRVHDTRSHHSTSTDTTRVLRRGEIHIEAPAPSSQCRGTTSLE